MTDNFSTSVIERMCGRGDDVAVAHGFVEGMQAVFARQGVVETPLLALRLDDVFANCVAVWRAEHVLDTLVVMAEQQRKRVPAWAEEKVAKARERLRKSMKELEESCAKAGTPIDVGLADVMKPILKKAEGVLEHALRTGAVKPREQAQSAESGTEDA